MCYVNFMQEMLMVERRPLPAADFVDAGDAIGRFDTGAEKNAALQERVGFVRAWYAISVSGGRWGFAPARWACHRNLPVAQYAADSQMLMDVRQAERCLAQWFEPVAPGSQQHAELMGALRQSLGRYGKQPSSAARIHVPKGVAQVEPDDDALVELLASVALRLDPVRLDRLKDRLDKGK